MGTHPKRLELSWHKPTKQWRKRFKRKEYYLGVGRGKTDLESYQRALEKWQAVKAGLEQQAIKVRRADEQERYTAWGEELANRPGIDLTLYVGSQSQVRPDAREREGRQDISEVARMLLASGWKPPVLAENGNGQTHTIGTLIKTFLQRREVLSSSGQRSLGRYENLRKCLSEFRDWAGTDTKPSLVNSRLLNEYHTSLLAKVSRKQMGEVCAKSRMQALRQFITWAWENEYIDLPRNIRSKDLEVAVTTRAVKAMDPADFRKLYDKANPRTRLFLLLMANCGMTQKDIADLKHTEVVWDQGRIVRKRSKTKKHLDVPTVNYKLWPETLELLKQFRSEHPELVLVNKTGQPLVRDFLKTTDARPEPYLVRVNSISYAYERLCDQLKIKGKLPLKRIRKTGATVIGRKFPWLVKLYLGHSVRSLDEKHYLAEDDARLDEALAWLRDQLLSPVP